MLYHQAIRRMPDKEIKPAQTANNRQTGHFNLPDQPGKDAKSRLSITDTIHTCNEPEAQTKL
jgi:hypothetical protein